jgi:hypothetical protein
MGVFGLVFGGVGLCVLALIWGNEFDFVPVPAKLFGSLVAVAFLAFGGTMAFTALRGGTMGEVNLPDMRGVADDTAPKPPATSPAGYVCPNCGAGLGAKADVSPMGDVKCPFCGLWFNVHGR